MIDPAFLFSIAGKLVLLGWLVLTIALFVKPVRPLALDVAQFVIPAILAAGYVLLIWSGRDGFAEGGFGSIAEVRALFANDSALAAGWLHYLAFDLFIGAWISRDSLGRGVPAFLVLPCLPLTFLFGPTGLLLYLILRLAFRSGNRETVQ